MLLEEVLVCGGVLMLPRREEKIAGEEKRFRLPYVNGKFIMPILFVATIVSIQILLPDFFKGLVDINSKNASSTIPMLIFFFVYGVVSILAFFKNFSLIPVLGLLSCCFLLTGMSLNNWAWFSSWLAIGLIVYFLYGYRKSKLATPNH